MRRTEDNGKTVRETTIEACGLYEVIPVPNTYSGINLGTETLRTIFRASKIGVAGIVRDISSVLNEFVGGGVIPAVTTPSKLRAAIQNKLNAQINFIASAQTSNLNPVS
jgi:hypothetical protein